MDIHEAAAIDAAHADYTHQWNLGVSSGRAFGDVVGPLIEHGQEGRGRSFAAALRNEKTHALCVTVPASWFDVSAERICDIMHIKSVYAARAASYSNNGMDAHVGSVDIMHVYILQLFFKIATVLWRWRDKNDKLPWDAPTDDTDSSSESSSSDDDDAPKKKKKRKKKKKKKRARLLGSVRRECGMAVDWRWREMCDECQTVRASAPWRIVFCDHVSAPGNMSPVLDYTFWFFVRGWSDDIWAQRVARATIAVIRHAHLFPDSESADGDAATTHTEPKGTAHNRRLQDGSDAWKNVNTANGFLWVANMYLRAMHIEPDHMSPPFEPRGGAAQCADLMGPCNPARVFSVATTNSFLGCKHTGRYTRQARLLLLSSTTLEIQYGDVAVWPQFWKRYLPHYDLLCVRPFSGMFPGVHHPTIEDLKLASCRDDAMRSIPFVGATSRGGGRAPVRSNADITTIWKIANESAEIESDGEGRALRAFMEHKADLFSPEERAVVPVVWRYVVRKRAFIRYMLQCRTPESHVSHALVSMWKYFFETNGGVYEPVAVRRAHGTETAECPWDFYYHNLTPFGNYMVNQAYHLWNHLNVDPPQVATGMLVLDAAANASRGERFSIGLNPLVHSTDPGIGKTFVTGELLSRTRIRGTWTAVSYKSGGAQNIQRMGTHDDMVVYIDEVRRGMFSNKDAGGMADSKQKELMSNGFVQSHVLTFTNGDGHNDRTQHTYTYSELCTLVSTGNLIIMDIIDKPFLTRWLLLPHNKCAHGVVKRPRTVPTPPPHVIQQFFQIQIATAEVHKMVQTRAMDVEDTFVVDLMLEALGEGLELTPDTQRKDIQIKSLARIHAIRDCIVTHFWLPGGLFYKKAITPSRLFALNDFLMVRAEHVVFAIGQLCNSATDMMQYSIIRAIVELWRMPNNAVNVQWGRSESAHAMEHDFFSVYDDTSSRVGFAPHISTPNFDTVVFEGMGRGFMRQFCTTIHFIISTQFANVEGLQKSIPTVDQIASYFKRWGGQMHVATRAIPARGTSASRACHPDAVCFTSESIAPEAMCSHTEVRGVVRIKFPTHMLLTASVTQNVIAGTRLEAMLRFSAETDAASMRAMLSGATSTDSRIPVFLYGGTIPGHQEYFRTIDFARPRDGAPDAPMIPYRYYARIMSDHEYSLLSGAPPPVRHDDEVPMVITLDEMAIRSRAKTVPTMQSHIDDALFARVVSKLVMGDFSKHVPSTKLAPLLRTSSMIWGVVYRAESGKIFSEMCAASQRAEHASATASTGPATLADNILCEYRHMPFCKNVPSEHHAHAMLSPVFTAVRRIKAMRHIHCAHATPFNCYNTISAHSAYPASTPQNYTAPTAQEEPPGEKRAHSGTCATSLPHEKNKRARTVSK